MLASALIDLHHVFRLKFEKTLLGHEELVTMIHVVKHIIIKTSNRASTAIRRRRRGGSSAGVAVCQKYL